MPETTSRRQPEGDGGTDPDPVGDRVREAAPGLTALLHEAEAARRLRAEVAGGDGASAVCAWNHFENIPTFYNWNNRPR
ncbi:multiple cyclophane-containing RiPP AmcA [Micromonospora sp. IBHARD004]|uniref:multiple cyclophane-containing RiPP AmcA n=1 Tax=Micromonospora sp. IBHARD004 TaxID=3457764 RepID=UPI00405805E3